MPAKLFLVGGGPVEPEPPFVLPPSARVVAGRGSSVDLVLLDREVSREHFAIRQEGADHLIEDLGSVNGTFVNGGRLERGLALRHGDTIQAGQVQLRFSTSEADSQEQVLAEAQARRPGAGSAVVEPPVEGGAPVVRVSLTPVLGQPKAHPDHTVRAFLEKHPRDTANKVFTWYQKLWYWAIFLGLILLFNWHPLHFLHVFHVFCTLYLVVIAYKLLAVFLSVISRGEVRVSPEEVAALSDEELPVYTILVPLYKETEVAGKIIRYLSRLDYPQEKLDVKLILEADDPGTIDVCRRTPLPPNYEIVIVPDARPKTKPKACNHGLERAKGEYLVIYDAEDRPEPDQLKKAIVAFRKSNPPRTGLSRLFSRAETVCLQAKLNYYNPGQNLLTKWFTIEYSTWFDLFLPGLHRLGSPIPLGGTSNHFKTSVLQFIGGWDPFNVTEDCDLGIRLHKMGFKTQILDSTTWEEANSRLWNWVRQRSRWVKGYVQTHLVHMRNPLVAFWKLGPVGLFGFLASVGGLSLMLLLNPFFWLITAFYGACWVHDLSLTQWNVPLTRAVQKAFNTSDEEVRRSSLAAVEDLWEGIRARELRKALRTRDTEAPGPVLDHLAGTKLVLDDMLRESVRDLEWPWSRWAKWRRPWVWRMVFNDPRGDPFWNAWSKVFFAMTVILFLGNFFFVLMHVLACLRRGLYGLIPHALFMPLYWILISLGAWKGFLQLFWNPFKWEKTRHGLDVSKGGPA